MRPVEAALVISRRALALGYIDVITQTGGLSGGVDAKGGSDLHSTPLRSGERAAGGHVEVKRRVQDLLLDHLGDLGKDVRLVGAVKCQWLLALRRAIPIVRLTSCAMSTQLGAAKQFRPDLLRLIGSPERARPGAAGAALPGHG